MDAKVYKCSGANNSGDLFYSKAEKKTLTLSFLTQMMSFSKITNFLIVL